MSNFGEVDKAVQTVMTELGGIDNLVNNAGITRDKLLLRMTEEEWDQVIRVNLKGTFSCTKAVVRHLVEERRQHRQHRFHRRSYGEPGPGELCGEQGRYHRFHEEHRKGIRREGRQG